MSKLVVVTEMTFDGDFKMDDGQLEQLAEHISDEAGSKILHITVRDGVSHFIGSIGTEAKFVGDHSEVMIIDEDHPPFVRADGNFECMVCGKKYREHPAHPQCPDLTVVCMDRVVKL